MISNCLLLMSRRFWWVIDNRYRCLIDTLRYSQYPQGTCKLLSLSVKIWQIYGKSQKLKPKTSIWTKARTKIIRFINKKCEMLPHRLNTKNRIKNVKSLFYKSKNMPKIKSTSFCLWPVNFLLYFHAHLKLFFLSSTFSWWIL